ncbi:hypothetical protein VTI74DRAFT_3565 [Chaetomium olivicolor]
MAASPVIVFQALSQTQQPSATAVEEIKKQDGFQRAFFGLKMEDPETAILATEWSSREEALGYHRSSSSPDAKETLAFVPAAAREAWDAAFQAPCTEVFTGFGAEEGFVANVGQFVRGVEGNRPEGFWGAAWGGSVALDEKGEYDGDVVRMVIGWTSKEAHLEAKGKPGAIQDNIELLRAKRKGVDLFHVEFGEL